MAPTLLAAITVACLCLTQAIVPLTEDIQTPVLQADVNYRLPLTIKPINYKILLTPYLNESDPKRFTFDGECYIEIQAVQKTKQIQLHVKNLNISLAEYYKKDSIIKSVLPTTNPDNLTSIVVYDLKEELQANTSYILHYKYVGSMDEDMYGFYRSNYTTSKNVTKWLGSTQLQRNHARRVFPSFDEPKFKATFDLSLTYHRSLISTGPTRLTETRQDGEYVTDTYATTPKMSTYLLAFVISEFSGPYDGEFGILARPEYYSQTEYSYNVGKRLVQALGDYLGISYFSMGNNKMQMAAIPDFASGAMENWGLLTYREEALLYDGQESSLNSKQYIASIIAHEQTHMWFGDYVTCEWWSYTWLNEGFASYFQYFGTHMVETYMKMDQQFVVNNLQTVMDMDATNATNPMTDENTNTEAELERMFNGISYSKGSSVIRMTKHIMGEDNFRKSLNEYLTKHQLTNTVPKDIFTVWKKYWPTNYTKYADNYFASFTTQVGYPVVLFNRTSATQVQVSQKRFLLKDFDKADPNLSYTVPITYTTSSENDFENVSPKFFIETTPQNIEVKKDTKWVLANIQETGYYRVNYDNKTWLQIRDALFARNWSGIHELNRAQIVDDVLNFARAGVVDYSLAFAVVDYLKTETNYLAWTAAFNAFNYLNMRLGTDTGDFGLYMQSLTENAYKNLGFDEKKEDTILDIHTRRKILNWCCRLRKAECISKMQTYFNENLKTKPVPVNIRPVVYCTAMREGSEKDFDKLYNKYKTETVATEEALIVNTLGCVKDPKLVSRFFDIIMSPEIRRQDKLNALFTLYSENSENVETVFDLVDQNVEQLSQALGSYFAVASAVSNIAARFTTEAQLEKLKAFNNRHSNKFGSSSSMLLGAVESVKSNLEWSTEKLGPIKALLYEYSHDSAHINSISVVSLIVVVILSLIC